MNFSNFDDSFCPILSIGNDKPIACQKNCAWYNPNASMCDLSVIAQIELHDPDILEIRSQNDESQQ